MDRRIAVAVSLSTLLVAVPGETLAQSCPEPLGGARRLVVVTADGMAASVARLRLFERTARGAPWRPRGAAVPARIGRAGMAWGHPYRRLARAGEPRKVEGDKRTPAGIYRLGRSFGFAASRQPGYLRLTAQTVCVDDVRSPAYNTITSRSALAPDIRVERLRADRRYRLGLWVDYPTNAPARAGSCIFIHVWKSPAHATTGCIAVSEARMARLQRFAAPGAVLAVLPQFAGSRWPGCLPR
jgi:L,D-peptidoglycan transpeptidase YkuD (ErfK/YbiS/YcfS/YnhG family)